MEIFSPEEWEQFIEEWLDIKRALYTEVVRFGGAGDMGRDVAAYITSSRTANYSWDCYQCKHYDDPLMPSQIWVEFGKIIFYTFKEEYPVPNKYYFVSPKGCGTSLTRLLQNPILLKTQIIDNWEKSISARMTSETVVSLTPELSAYIENFDFSIFDRIQPKNLIDEHKAHPNHLTWFGGGLPDRSLPEESSIPAEIGVGEVIYVDQLVKPMILPQE